ncbi:thermonuclease family protein [Cellulomonas hominis]|uniref:thermonuclease family protein n=1 Tax=Cellulomonas hominis TaxID=156981 RepID=UPI0019C0C5CA|nr:thermonuclease family protein [Cellulomonas hominis]MBD3777711.1 thermonuclease family protein [Micrococcales bacterium]MBU5421178.1 thermonuclease family protein [Cellulomonas hominis]
MEVVRVVDGDTLIIDQDGTEVRVRLLGIDTPESVKPDSPVECYGPEAAARTNELAAGKVVRLEGDPTQDTVDQYGRTLAYVWLDDATMLNELLVAEGYAREYTYDQPGSHQAELLEAQQRAQTAGAGLWSACTDRP